MAFRLGIGTRLRMAAFNVIFVHVYANCAQASVACVLSADVVATNSFSRPMVGLQVTDVFALDALVFRMVLSHGFLVPL